MKKIIIKYTYCTLALLACFTFYGQRYTCKAGHVRFEASVPSFEEVAAQNKGVSAMFDAATGDIAVLALMKGFRFKVALMEEHFNENYAETDKYPKATFKGNIQGLDVSKLGPEPQIFKLTGSLTLHGKTKQVAHMAEVALTGSTITIKGSFEVNPGDFDIEIPAVVSKKIASKVLVSYSLPLTN